MIRKIALSLICVGALSLGACNRNDSSSDRRDSAMFGPNEGVWYNGNGERVHHSQLTQTYGGDWYAASPDERRMSEAQDDMQDSSKPCTCTEAERAAKQRMRQNSGQ